jgi:hypothetical protein
MELEALLQVLAADADQLNKQNQPQPSEEGLKSKQHGSNLHQKKPEDTWEEIPFDKPRNKKL